MTKLGWLEKLKELVKVELKLDARLIDNRQITIINDSSKKGCDNEAVYIDKRNQELAYLDLSCLNDKQKKKLAPILEEYIGCGDRLLQVETSQLLENLCKYGQNRDAADRKILEFFRGIIPLKDIEALEAALYLRAAFKRHENIEKLKRDILNAFGQRGANITKLCSAGYFEGFLIPLYNETSKEAEGAKKFAELYGCIVDKAVLAVFVHQDMSQAEITAQISEKIEISKKYGIGFIHIRGIGRNNVTKIKQWMGGQKDSAKFIEKNVFERENIIIIELLF